MYFFIKIFWINNFTKWVIFLTLLNDYMPYTRVAIYKLYKTNNHLALVAFTIESHMPATLFLSYTHTFAFILIEICGYVCVAKIRQNMCSFKKKFHFVKYLYHPVCTSCTKLWIFKNRKRYKNSCKTKFKTQFLFVHQLKIMNFSIGKVYGKFKNFSIYFRLFLINRFITAGIKQWMHLCWPRIKLYCHKSFFRNEF